VSDIKGKTVIEKILPSVALSATDAMCYPEPEFLMFIYLPIMLVPANTHVGLYYFF